MEGGSGQNKQSIVEPVRVIDTEDSDCDNFRLKPAQNQNGGSEVEDTRSSHVTKDTML